jgi:glutaredoxin
MITLYTKPGCPWCIKAKELLKSKGVNYHEIMIDNDKGDVTREEFINLFPMVKSLPYMLDSNGKSIGGYGELIDFLNP